VFLHPHARLDSDPYSFQESELRNIGRHCCPRHRASRYQQHDSDSTNCSHFAAPFG
jgi:hypothetical protein